MKKKTTAILAAMALSWLILASIQLTTKAQQPTPSPTPTKSPEAKTESSTVEAGEDAGDYTIISSLELGYRIQKVDGDVNKYRSDLNYKAGPRLFDSSFLMRSKDGKGDLFDTLLVTSTGWGSDPYGNLRVNVEKPESGVARRSQVSAPQPLNHHALPSAFSCMSCHNGKRAFGGDDFSVCTRCHTRTTWHF